MNGEPLSIWFWQTEVSPHMAGLISAVANLDCEVVYVVNQTVSYKRTTQGWLQPDIGKARLELAPTEQAVRALAEAAPLDSVHFCEGLRSNGLVGKARHTLARRSLRLWVVMETVEDVAWSGLLKRLEYRRILLKWRRHLQGILAIGYQTPDWIAARGMPADRVFPFAYFLNDVEDRLQIHRPLNACYQLIFVGQFIHRKRLDLLIAAIRKLNTDDIKLTVVGSGPLENEWRLMAETALPGRVNWLGRLTMNEVSAHIALADCLVLPSQHDGWGAVVSEALMVGTPVICSDACGAAGVVMESGHGSVFRAGDVDSLVQCLATRLSYGYFENKARKELMSWARCLGANAGADYLLQILSYSDRCATTPLPPWVTVPTVSSPLPPVLGSSDGT